MRYLKTYELYTSKKDGDDIVEKVLELIENNIDEEINIKYTNVREEDDFLIFLYGGNYSELKIKKVKKESNIINIHNKPLYSYYYIVKDRRINEYEDIIDVSHNLAEKLYNILNYILIERKNRQYKKNRKMTHFNLDKDIEKMTIKDSKELGLM